MPRRHERKPPGTPSPQRTDRNDAAAQNQPVRTARGQTYGEGARQERAQQQVPLPDNNARFAQALKAAEAADTGDPIDLLGDGPPEPGEVTAGLPTGPGPGPEAIPNVAGSQPQQNPDAQFFAGMLPALEALASRPGSSVATRNIVRRMRAQLPPDFSYSEVPGAVPPGEEGAQDA